MRAMCAFVIMNAQLLFDRPPWRFATSENHRNARHFFRRAVALSGKSTRK
jgi:hypothetical protein